VRSAEARVTAAESEFERLTAAASPELRAQRAAALSEAKRRLETIRAASARWTPPLAVALCILTGAAAGLLNGAIITRLKVIPFIVTLGTMSVFLGLAKLIANETTVRPLPGQRPDWLANLLSVRAPVLGLPPGVWITLALAVVLAIVLQRTVFGRHVYALGSNEATARLCGIDVARTKLIVYAIGGLFVGLAGILFFSRVGNGNPTSGNDYALRIIAAVVIGGGSLNGGRGTVLGTITGAAIVEVIRSGGTQLGLSNPVQDVILGVIIVAAVVIDQWRQRANE
jgi:ribose/xylose/arabinose/galactoside ABC-type transport system permease subunit